jgi:hypothetical protein
MARIAASYNTIAYNVIPINRGKMLLEEHNIKIWNATYKYINSTNAYQLQTFYTYHPP